MGIPIVACQVNGKSANLFLDTGAKLSYISNNETNHLQGSGKVDDFYPDFGTFSTNVFNLETKIGKHTFMAN